MARKLLLLLTFFGGISNAALAQFYSTQYRPPNQEWQFLKTPHFKLIYSQGNDSTALQMGQILEEQYPLAQHLVGGELRNFPIILNDYNDRSNGFVTPINFRSEIELPPIKGKSLNPQSGNWMQIVGPHELVHALQFSNLGDYNIPRLVSIFSPDLARSFHAALPPGALEGIAVHHETINVAPNGGRGNHPIFTNQFEAVFKSNRRWSMGEMMQPPGYTRPFGRYYIGGYEFTSWLQNKYGAETSRQLLDFYMDFPFLGYGVALRHATGYWPGQLYDQFEKDITTSLSNQPNRSQKITPLNIPLKGREIRRPKWLSDSTLIFYGSFYNARPGFYSYNLTTHNLERRITTNTITDYRYDLSADKSQLVYSYYQANALYDNTAKAELVVYDFSSDGSRQLTHNGRLYAPLFLGDSLLALQSRPVSSQLVSLSKSQHSSHITEIASLGNHNIVAVDAHPKTNTLAVVVNKVGMQALWISKPTNLSTSLRGAPNVAFSRASIFDPEWHPTKQKLMFSSDISGSRQLYEYDLDNNSIIQITGGSNNAFEGSYSPDGNRVAFIRQAKNERLPAIIKRTNFLDQSVDQQSWQPTSSNMKFMQRPMVSDSMAAQAQQWKTGDYSTGMRWLKPRTWWPILEEVSNRNKYKAGFSIHSGNTLANQSYSAAFSYFEERGWYDLTYQNTTFFPGFKARIFSQPSYRFADNIGMILRQERALALSLPMEVQLNQNIFNTSLFIEPEFRRSQIRYFSLGQTDSRSNFADVNIANMYGQFNYRLQQNIRDIQPNSGLIFYSEAEYLGGGEDLTFNVSGNQLRISNSNETALRGGFFSYISPLRKWNQSLRIGLEGITQTAPIFDTQQLPSDAFSGSVFPFSNNLLSFNTRYTIPLKYVDNGGVLVPFYLSNIYMVLFTDTIVNPGLADWTSHGRSVFGLGIRSRFRFGNLNFDIGVGFGFEPNGDNQFFIGDF